MGTNLQGSQIILNRWVDIFSRRQLYFHCICISFVFHSNVHLYLLHVFQVSGAVEPKSWSQPVGKQLYLHCNCISFKHASAFVVKYKSVFVFQVSRWSSAQELESVASRRGTADPTTSGQACQSSTTVTFHPHWGFLNHLEGTFEQNCKWWQHRVKLVKEAMLWLFILSHIQPLWGHSGENLQTTVLGRACQTKLFYSKIWNKPSLQMTKSLSFRVW